jgi:hypothetical protein
MTLKRLNNRFVKSIKQLAVVSLNMFLTINLISELRRGHRNHRA